MLRPTFALTLLLVSVPAHAGRYLPAIAVAIATIDATPAPPQPRPPSDVCDNCNGTGKLGDGTVFVDCPVCGGDGRLDDTAGGATPSSAASLDAPPALIQSATVPAAAQQPTPMAAIGAALQALQPRVGETFFDLGCGLDARACIVAARDCGLTAVGVEIDPATAESARHYVAANGLADKITIVTADAADVDIPTGAIGYAYLWPEALERLAPQIRRFSRFASYAHVVPGLTMQQQGDVYLYRQPQLVTVPRTTATWGGWTYSGPVCSRTNCPMCAAIRSQLATPEYVWQQQQQPAATQPRGRWVTQKICRGGGQPCEYRRVWQPF